MSKQLLTTQDVVNLILTKQPISLIRYGDGEAIILNGWKDVNSLKAVFKRQFGFTPSIEEAEQIRENLIKAYNECDIIGTPLGKKMKDEQDYWSRSLDILRIEANIDILTTAKLPASIDIHSEMLVGGHYDTIISNFETLNYISCRDLDEQFKKKFPHLKRINKFIVSPETKFSTNKTGEKHFPDQFNKIPKWMDKAISCEGALCLVGAGFVGKIYCNWFRDRGGVAIDIGSVFDSWSGKATRGPNRGFEVIDDTYKL